MVHFVKNIFDKAMTTPNQIDKKREDVQVTQQDLLEVPLGNITEEGVRTNISVGIQYIAAWLLGRGAVPINNLMEDAATAEISRAQLWQWLRHDAGPLTREAYRALRERELHDLVEAHADAAPQLRDAARLLDEIVLDDDFAEFLTVRAYPSLP